MKKLSVVFAIMAIIAMMMGCATTAYQPSLVDTTYRILTVSKTSYETAMQIAADLDRRGQLTERQRSDVMEYGAVYSNAHNAAVDALFRFADTKDVAERERFERQVDIASEALTKLLMIIKPYTEV